MLAEQAIPIQELRARGVLDAVERIRAATASGVSRESLEDVKAIVTELASRTHLFPREQFPLGANGAPRVYYLAQDPDGTFAIYASAGAVGKSQPPHNHTTWAVISGVYGEEHNVLYRRTDDGSRGDSDKGSLEHVGEVTVRRGNAVSLLPNDFHTIKVIGEDDSLHLHAYGRSLEQLPERIRFEGPAGGNFRHFPANPNITSPRISAPNLKALMRSQYECAVLDVRDEAAYASGHLFYASSIPIATFEERIGKLVPRRAACIVLIDDAGGEAEAASAILRRLGRKNVSILDGGVAAWKDAGYELFSGFNVPSKAFGEVVERRDRTPHISAAELKALLGKKEPVVILDSRPLEEFANMSIPGALSCPGAELVYRVQEVASDSKTLVVVNCAGRTRSIIGAQSLIASGLENRVVALENGTMGWQLAGFELEHGATRRAPAPKNAKHVRERARRVAEENGVQSIDLRQLEQFRNDVERTLYVFDVRTPEEYRDGHIAGSRCAPGGQLVQATDLYVGVRSARIVLADSDGVRARMTASWLAQMSAGEIFVLDESAFANAVLERGQETGWTPEFGTARNKPYGSAGEMQAYLTWEVGLIEQIRRDGDAPFLRFLRE